MIAANASTWIAFLEGSKGKDVLLLDKALKARQLLMGRLTELLSDPTLPSEVAKALSEVPIIEIRAGYWQRAGGTEREGISKGAHDALVAQTC